MVCEVNRLPNYLALSFSLFKAIEEKIKATGKSSGRTEMANGHVTGMLLGE